MSNGNALQQMQKPKFSVAIRTDLYKNLINSTLGDPERAKRFVAAISSAVAINPALQECDAGSILSAGLLGESLNLSPSPQLGLYYMVPYSTTMKDRDGRAVIGEDGKPVKVKMAQFQLGYKGYMQLAVRSGEIKSLNVMSVKEGELIRYDPYEGIFEAKHIDDEEEREQRATIGYYAMFELLNGYRRILFWTHKKMLAHADKYSQAFSAAVYEKIQRGEIPEKDMWKYSSFWYKNFDDMACKTMLRQLIAKGGCPMSTEMQSAYERDMASIKTNGSYEYVDSPSGGHFPNSAPESLDDGGVNEQVNDGRNQEEPEDEIDINDV